MPDIKTLMKKCVSAIIIVIFLHPVSVWSTPREVTLFPDSAYVHEVTKLKLQAENKDLRKAIVILPGKLILILL